MNELNPDIRSYTKQLRTRVCGICISDHKLLLVKHKSTLKNDAFWAVPGGGLHYGETMRYCLKREFLEETGLQVEVGRYLFMNEYIDEPLHAIEHFFEVHIIGGTLKAGFDPEVSVDKQIIESVHFVNRAEINQIPLPDKHRMLHHLYSLDDLLGMENHFVN